MCSNLHCTTLLSLPPPPLFQNRVSLSSALASIAWSPNRRETEGGVQSVRAVQERHGCAAEWVSVVVRGRAACMLGLHAVNEPLAHHDLAVAHP